MNDEEMRYMQYSPRAPNVLWRIAKDVAAARVEANKRLSELNKSQDRGARNFELELVGVVAELVYWDFLDSEAQDFEATPIIALKWEGGELRSAPQKRVDLIQGQKEFDIKGIPPSARAFHVNQAAHANESKRPEYYIFVRPHVLGVGGDFDFYLIPSAAVDAWPVRVSEIDGEKKAPYHAKPINELVPRKTQ